ncbi:hypothetical protein N7475_005422 [Penicillium sp. IBT 31633x]|nr:hypothetical protein N7475_005422 [Penicillium sp. IBT 31633x]
MAGDTLSWVDMEESENERVSNKSNAREVLERLEGLEVTVREFKQEKTEENDDIIARIDSLEDAVRHLEVGRERLKKQQLDISREAVLDAWSQGPTSSLAQRGPNASAHRGDIRADIQAIITKEETDPETADRWKVVFLERYGLDWENNRSEIAYLKVDIYKRNDMGRMIRLFNIRAHVFYGWGETRIQILDRCDDWIGEWIRSRAAIPSPTEYRELCRLYYT